MAEPVETVVERLGAQGDGVAGVGDTIRHIPFVLPGERLRLTGGTAQVLAPSPDRVAAPCRHFGTCGGCQIQHLAAPAAAAWKRRLVADALGQRGLDQAIVLPTVSLPPGARRRARFAVLRLGRRVLLGFHERRSARLVDLAECPVLAPAIARLVDPLRALAGPLAFAAATVTDTDGGLDVVLTGGGRAELAARERLARFADDQDLARLSWGDETIVARRPATIAFDGVAVTIPPGSFLQPSRAGEAALVAAIRDRLGNPARIVDLFAGCGSFTLPLARLAPVLAVEQDAAAAAALGRAARGAAGLKPITVLRRDLFREPLEAPDLDHATVVIDPPREGAIAQSRALAASAVRRIVALSCNPATFSRDARILVDAGFTLHPVQPVDQFAWSAHIELVALFER